MKRISVVIPVYNEEENIRALFDEVIAVCRHEKYIFEIILVDDGSTDDTGKIAKGLSPVKYIRLQKNFGQTAAMDAGIKAAKYDYIVTMDGDRQNDPADITKLLECMEANDYDVVSGWRKDRKDTFMKRFISRGANLLRGILIKDNIHDSGCSLKAYRRECFENLNLYGEMHRFIPAFLKIKGYSVGEVVVNHRPRTAGKTKYNWKRTFKGFVDMVSVWFWSKYAVRPLHVLGGMGVFSFLIGGILSIRSVILLFVRGISFSSQIPFIAVCFLLCGMFLFILGIMSDILSKIYFGTGIDKPYSIREVVENGNEIEGKSNA